MGSVVQVTVIAPAMDSQQKFCLKWNQFNQNIKDVFNELRQTDDMFDVTIALDDGTQIGAHKVILAACSSFFRGLFTTNQHIHPWIYLKGIKSFELNAVVDFMYQGEVNVPQDSLTQFLETAEDLKVKGLSGYNGAPGTINNDETIVNDQEFKNDNSMSHPEAIGIDWNTENDANKNTGDCVKVEYNELIDSEGNLDKLDFNQGVVITEEEPNVINEKIVEVNAELDKQIEDILVRSNGLWICKVCGKSANHKSKLKQHVETHINGFSHQCGLCGKSYRSRNVLRMHMSRD